MLDPLLNPMDSNALVEQRRDQLTYRYLPLPNADYFRIITICPGSIGDPIVTRLNEWYIGSNVKYEALSYHWGISTADVKITIECDTTQQEFYVRPNLEAALKHLRYRDKERHLWIDAICIDQTDDQEKSSQIPRMADIFYNATSVCV